MTGNNSGKQKRQLFPEKLWELVNSQQGSGIRWSPSNNKCIEIERSKLERYLQTKFRSQNFDSFIRQLHFYGFKKYGNSYFHDKFQRDHPDRIHSMRRKYSLNMLANPHNKPNQNSSSSALPEPTTTTAAAAVAATQKGPPLSLGLPCDGPPNPLEMPTLVPPMAPQLRCAKTPPPAHQHKSWKEIKMYTVDLTNDDEDDLGAFTNVRETNARAIRDSEGLLKISIPRSLVNIAGTSGKQGPWPRSLVLECYKHGEQSILSAFFVYRLS